MLTIEPIPRVPSGAGEQVGGTSLLVLVSALAAVLSGINVELAAQATEFVAVVRVIDGDTVVLDSVGYGSADRNRHAGDR